LPVVPRLKIHYRGVELQEMDIDAILKLKPEYVLVDELAHTNAEGARHRKRYQDVLELLDHGINVYTTLNVQHVESLIDTVRQITGITVHETVPDSILDRADEIELIDLPPQELLKRLSEGKVYTPERSATAIQNFFRKGNLTALRENRLAQNRRARRHGLAGIHASQSHRRPVENGGALDGGGGGESLFRAAHSLDAAHRRHNGSAVGGDVCENFADVD
jgi:two-component system sensor histidine kinase KdpD